MNSSFTNRTNSLQLNDVAVTDYEQEVKDKRTGATHRLKLRDYALTLKNTSSRPIDAIIFSFSIGNELKGTQALFYRYTENQFAPQAVLKYPIRGIPAERTPSVEVVIFNNNTYEGNSLLAQDMLERWEGARLQLLKMRPEINRLDQLTGANFSTSVQQFIQQLQQEKQTSNVPIPTGSAETERTQANIRLGTRDMIEHTLHLLKPDLSYNKQKAVMQSLRRWINRRTEQLNHGR